MNKYVVKFVEVGSEVRTHLLRKRTDLRWYTSWIDGQGCVIVVHFDNQEDAVEFQLRFLGNIDYQST